MFEYVPSDDGIQWRAVGERFVGAPHDLGRGGPGSGQSNTEGIDVTAGHSIVGCGQLQEAPLANTHFEQQSTLRYPFAHQSLPGEVRASSSPQFSS